MKMITNMKSERIVKLAKKAGFVIWSKNDYAVDRIGKVDWACEYDQELEQFYDLVVQETLEKVKRGQITF